jgi:SAM-dependent methyltransferase
MDARYDAVADFYEGSFPDAPDPVVTALLGMLGPHDGVRVLDLACGYGRVARELARGGAAVTGIDLSRAMLNKARSIEDAQPLGVRYVHGDATSAPDLDSAGFDAVVCNFGLSDIDDLDGALDTVLRVLRPGGAFVFSILHPCFPGAGPVSGAWPSRGRYYDEGFWLADGAASTLRRQVGANHRMLSTYLNALTRRGLLLKELAEPEPPTEWNTTNRRDATRFPVFLAAHCIRSGTD